MDAEDSLQDVVSAGSRINREHHHANDTVRLRLTASYVALTPFSL
jgi:hypothetical protein